MRVTWPLMLLDPLKDVPHSDKVPWGDNAGGQVGMHLARLSGAPVPNILRLGTYRSESKTAGSLGNPAYPSVHSPPICRHNILCGDIWQREGEPIHGPGETCVFDSGDASLMLSAKPPCFRGRFVRRAAGSRRLARSPSVPKPGLRVPLHTREAFWRSNRKRRPDPCRRNLTPANWPA